MRRSRVLKLPRALAFLVLLLALAPALASAQSTVQQVGPVTQSHSAVWIGNGQVGDSSQFPLWQSNQLDAAFGATPGEILCRNASAWQALPAGVGGQYLVTGGPTGCPGWTTTTPGATPVSFTRAQIPTQSIGPNQTVSVAGYRTGGDQGLGAVYSSVNCTSTGWEAIQDAGGTWFCLVSPVSDPGYFGAYGDGTAHTLTSADIAANPQWRGQYNTTETWDDAAVEESKFYAYANAAVPNTPLASIPWNSISGSNALNRPWYEKNGTFYLTNTVTEVSSRGSNTYASRGSCWFWHGTEGATTPLYFTDSTSYTSFYNICLSNLQTGQIGQGSPLWIMDHDGTYSGLATQNLLISNGFFSASGLNNPGVAINPITHGLNSQGSTITFVNAEFTSNSAGGTYCLQVNGTNALNVDFFNSDMQACSQNGIEVHGGSTVYVYGSSFENQNTSFVYPIQNQITTLGADLNVLTGGSGASAVSRMQDVRVEDEVPMSSAPGAFSVADNVQAIGVSVSGSWVASNHFFEGGTISATVPAAVVTGSISGATLTVSGVTSGTLHVGQTITGAGVAAGTTIGSYLSGAGGTGTYSVSPSQTVGSETLSAGSTGYLMMIDDGGPVSQTGGVGAQGLNGWFPVGTGSTSCVVQDPNATYTANAYANDALYVRFSNGTIGGTVIASNTSTSLTLSPCLAFAPSTATTYHILRSTGTTRPSWAGAATSFYTPGGSQGFSLTAGIAQIQYTSQTPSGQMVVGSYILIPNADAAGGAAGGGGGSAALPGPFIAAITGSCGTGCATLNKTPNASVSFGAGYVFTTPIVDNGETWGLIPFNSLTGVMDVRSTHVPGIIAAAQQVTNSSSALGIAGVVPGSVAVAGGNQNNISALSFSQQWGALYRPFSGGVTNFPEPQNDLTPAFLSADDLYLSASGDAVLNAPVPQSHVGATKHVWIESTTVAHTITFGANFSGVAPFTTDGKTGDEWEFTFESDGANGTTPTWRATAGPGVGRGFVFAPHRKSGNWYIGAIGTGGAGLTTASTTTIYFAPLYLFSPVTITNLGVFLITGQSASDIQLAIYPDNGSGAPLTTNGPLMATGNIVTTGSATNVSAAVTATTLQGGPYWAAVMSNNAGVVVANPGADPGSMQPALVGASSQVNLQSSGTVFTEGYTLTGQTFGTWPTSGTPTANAAGGSTGPLIQYESQ